MCNAQARAVLIHCLDLACARVVEARVTSLHHTLDALHRRAPYDFDVIQAAAARLKHEEQRRRRIASALDEAHGRLLRSISR